MTKSVVIVDYGSGNILSVARAFEQSGVEVKISNSPKEVGSASRLVVPGVGAFGDCVAKLRALGLDQAVLDFVIAGRPLMGICVGMQMLFEGSNEFGEHKGLGLFPGFVESINSTDEKGARLKVPHIGWAELRVPEERKSWDGTPLCGLDKGSSAYFVHSFHGVLKDPRHCVAYVSYGGMHITSAIFKENIFGTQFHPEKSGAVGFKIIQSFMELM